LKTSARSPRLVFPPSGQRKLALDEKRQVVEVGAASGVSPDDGPSITGRSAVEPSPLLSAPVMML